MSAPGAEKIMNFTTRGAGLEEWIRDFSAHLKATPDKNVVIYPESFATGFAKVYAIEEGLTYRFVDYTLNTDFVFTRKPASEFYLIIYLYQYTDCNKLCLTINNKVIADNKEKEYSNILMTNSFASQRLELSKGTIVKGLTIQLTEKWLHEKIAQPNTANYTMFKEKDIFLSFINPTSQKLLAEIFEENCDSATPALHMNCRVLRLLEDFLCNILKNGVSDALPVSDKDVQQILKVASMIRESYAEFPGIEKLARVALMSKTKLKRIFKRAYRMGVYEYFQKNRINKARELLDSGKYSVCEVGALIGYQNLSNFSNAFKKEFNFLPRDFKKIGQAYF